MEFLMELEMFVVGVLVFSCFVSLLNPKNCILMLRFSVNIRQ